MTEQIIYCLDPTQIESVVTALTSYSNNKGLVPNFLESAMDPLQIS